MLRVARYTACMRTLEDIVPPSKRPRPSVDMPADAGTSAPLRLKPRAPRFPTTTVVLAAIILVAAIGALFYFSGAKVEVTPTSVSAAVQASLSATQGTGDLPFVIVSTSKIATQSVTGSGTKTVNSSASGTLTVYNTSGTAQHFVKNTRFATASGLIFRSHTTLSVPSGTSAKPGSASVTVYADQPGASYNVAPSTFTLPGLAGTKLGTEISARSSTSFTGGASGTVPVVDSATESQAVAAMKQALVTDIATALSAQVPPGYILVPGSATTTYAELTPSPSSTTGMVDVKEQATATAVVFPNAALAKALAGSVPGLGYQGEPITLENANGLMLTPATGLPDASTQSFSFSVAGTANLVYTVVPDHIASAVAGKTRTAAQVALSNFPEVKQAVLILRPFWRSTFPQDPASITVTVLAPAGQ